jgi:serine/threonine protein kinase
MTTTTDLFAGRYRLGELIGRGGMSDVYRAEDRASGNPVAVKVVRSGDPELARRLAQEVKVMQRMGHPGLIQLLDTGVADGQAYLVMELIDGATLAASLRGGPLGARLTTKLGTTLADALAHVHQQGIVHRDVKPSNVMLSADGRALLGDFGISRFLDASTFTLDGTTLGTVAYMAPEQLEDHTVGPPADIWSLGIVLLESLTGRRVYEGSSSEIIARRLAGPVPLPGDLPVPWKLLLSGMLDHRPDQRLAAADVASLLASPVFSAPWSPSATEATPRQVATVPHDLTALAGVAAATAVRAPEAPTATRARPPSHRPTRHARRWWLVALVVAVLAGAGVGLALALPSNKSPGPSAPPPAGRTHGATSTTTTSPTTTTTTTAPPSAPAALGTLVGDVASAVDNGSLDPATGRVISTQAQQAVTDEAAAKPNQAANDLQQAAIALATASQDGTLDPSEATVLQGDLTTLAGALGLSAAGTPPVTSSTLPSGPAHPGHGPGHGGAGG